MRLLHHQGLAPPEVSLGLIPIVGAAPQLDIVDCRRAAREQHSSVWAVHYSQGVNQIRPLPSREIDSVLSLW